MKFKVSVNTIPRDNQGYLYVKIYFLLCFMSGLLYSWIVTLHELNNHIVCV
jgi:hypothetical protein